MGKFLYVFTYKEPVLPRPLKKELLYKLGIVENIQDKSYTAIVQFPEKNISKTSNSTIYVILIF